MGKARRYKAPTIEELTAEASKHATRTEFNKATPKLYRYAWSNGLLDEICAHMQDARREWTREKLLVEASKYHSLNEFRELSNKAYQAARYHNLLDECCDRFSKSL